MSATTPGISIGDAILTVSVDLGNLRQSLDQVGPLVTSKLQPAGAAVNALGTGFTGAGTAATAAGAQISASVQAPLDRIKALEAEVANLRQQLQTVGGAAAP